MLVGEIKILFFLHHACGLRNRDSTPHDSDRSDRLQLGDDEVISDIVSELESQTSSAQLGSKTKGNDTSADSSKIIEATPAPPAATTQCEGSESGVQLIRDATNHLVRVKCNYQHGHMWTLVYKIADRSTMRSANAVNVDALQHASDTAHSGKLSDTSIKELCATQFWIQQQGVTGNYAGNLYCTFDDVNRYGDAARSSKRCGERFSAGGYSTAYGPNDQRWSNGFSSWTTTGSIITQMNHQDGSRSGSHIQRGSTPVSGSGCNSQGGCHTEVWCLGEDPWRDPGNDGWKCGNPGSPDRTGVLRNAAATFEACKAACDEDAYCIAFSGIHGSWCIGCRVPLSEGHEGAIAFKKPAR